MKKDTSSKWGSQNKEEKEQGQLDKIDFKSGKKRKIILWLMDNQNKQTKKTKPHYAACKRFTQP